MSEICEHLIMIIYRYIAKSVNCNILIVLVVWGTN